MKTIINETNKYCIKDICKWIRETLKEKYPDLKFNVSMARGGFTTSVYVYLMESKNIRFIKNINEVSEHEILKFAAHHYLTEEKAKQEMNKYLTASSYGINPYYIENDFGLTDKGKEILLDVKKIINTHNWDRSNTMIDYFDVNYYVNMGIGKSEKPFIDGKN
jgi:hypothetical protein